MSRWLQIALETCSPNKRADKTDNMDKTAIYSSGSDSFVHSVHNVQCMYEFEERAAIIEYDARISREWAEAYARLCLKPIPTGFRRNDWQDQLNGFGRRLDKSGCA